MKTEPSSISSRPASMRSAVDALDEPASQQNLDRLARELEAGERDPCESRDLGGEAVDDLARDRVPGRLREHDRRELDDPALLDPLAVDRLRELVRQLEPE